MLIEIGTWYRYEMRGKYRITQTESNVVNEEPDHQAHVPHVPVYNRARVADVMLASAIGTYTRCKGEDTNF